MVSATNVDARTTSSVVTPNSLRNTASISHRRYAAYFCCEPFRIKDAVLFEDFGNNRDCGIDRIRDDKDSSLGTGSRNARGKIAYDPRIDLQITTAASIFDDPEKKTRPP